MSDACSGRVPSPLPLADILGLTPQKKELLSITMRNACNMAIALGQHRTLGGEDTAMRYALNGLAEGVIVEFFDILRMIDQPDMHSPQVQTGPEQPGGMATWRPRSP